MYLFRVAWGITDYAASNPKEFALYQNYPNPFNPNTTIEFEIPNRRLIRLKVFDILGNEVTELLNEERTAGSYKIEFNTSSLSSGVYCLSATNK